MKPAGRKRSDRRSAAASAVDALEQRARTAARRARACDVLEKKWAALEDRTGPEALDLLVAWLRAQVKRIGATGCVLGASGGVDSSLVAVLAARAAGKRCHALIMPCRGDPADEKDARALLEVLGVPYRVVDVHPLVEMMCAMVPGRSVTPTARGNLASRLRNALLYLEANQTGALVMGTGNLDETYLGYSSKGTTADLFPITGLHKDEVRALFRLALAPVAPALAQKIIRRPPSPGYWKGQKAEDELGIRYRRVAPALDVLIAACDILPQGVVPRNRETMVQMMEQQEVAPQEILTVADHLMRNHHKAFGSPALWRTEPLAVREP